MAKAQHETPEYRAARRRFAIEVAAGRGWCAQPVCVMASRYIPPGTPWDTAHNDEGTVVLGAAHRRRCNRRDGAKRGNRMRARRYPPHPRPLPRRWVL